MIKRIGGVICCGNIVMDILVKPVNEVIWGRSFCVGPIAHLLGGNGASTTVALARLGVPVHLLAWIGADLSGDRLLNEIMQAGADVSAVARSSLPTPETVALINEGGERTFLHHPGASMEAFPGPIDFAPNMIAGKSHFHLANIFGLPNMRLHAAETLRRAKAAALTTSVDTGWDSRGEWLSILHSCLPFIDLLFVNGEEGRMLTGHDAPDRISRILMEEGARAIVLKLGARGSAVFEGDWSGAWPAHHVEVRDTTGAGDCFVGGFLAALHRGYSYDNAARFANAVAALKVQHLGATTGLLSFEETETWMNNNG